MSEQEKIKVAAFTPRGLENPKEKDRIQIRSFTPEKLRGDVINDYGKVKNEFGSLASTDEKANPRFHLYPDSKRLLGVDQEERSHLDHVIAEEVEKRFDAVKDKAHAEGYQNGLIQGKEETRKALETQFLPAWQQFQAFLKEIDSIKQDIYVENERVLMNIIFNISKQVMLKELKVDREYLQRLCLNLIDRIGIKENLKIKVSRGDSQIIDELKEFLKSQIEGLRNVQIEVSEEVQLGGCKIESNLIRINASVESQFKAIEDSFKES